MLLPGPEVLKDRYFVDQAKGEGGEVTRAVLGRRHHQHVEGGVEEKPMADKGRGNPAFADTSEGFDDLSIGAVLKAFGDVVLDRRRIGEV